MNVGLTYWRNMWSITKSWVQPSPNICVNLGRRKVNPLLNIALPNHEIESDIIKEYAQDTNIANE